MKRIAEHARILIFFFMAAAILNGCQAFSQGVGQTVAPEKRKPLEAGGPHTGAFVTRDLIFSYKYDRQGDRMTVNGDIEFRGAVANFPIMHNFYLQAYYLNAAGQVISTERFYSSVRSTESGIWRFTRKLTMPPETAGWALGYSGFARDFGPAGDAATWSFWGSPFK